MMDDVLIKPTEFVPDAATLTDRYGSFVCEPLEPGYALTVGNALRRVLLSSIRGAAVTSMRIEGVLHELSTIPGVLEDVTDIVLNVKAIAFRADAEGPHTVHLACDGPCVARAGDLRVPTGLVVLDPDAPIATLDRDGRLRLELTVKTGHGYVAAERHGVIGAPIGTIAVDGLHSPIRRVNYTVSRSRTGSSFIHERLTLFVWTNGAVTPQDAVGVAARILHEQLVPFERINDPLPEPVHVVAEPPPWNDHLLLPLDELTLSVRATNCMESANIRLIGDLVQRTDSEILKIRNMGRKTLREIQQSLREIGLSLGMRIPNWAELRERGRDTPTRLSMPSSPEPPGPSA